MSARGVVCWRRSVEELLGSCRQQHFLSYSLANATCKARHVGKVPCRQTRGCLVSSQSHRQSEVVSIAWVLSIRLNSECEKLGRQVSTGKQRCTDAFSARSCCTLPTGSMRWRRDSRATSCNVHAGCRHCCASVSRPSDRHESLPSYHNLPCMSWPQQLFILNLHPDPRAFEICRCYLCLPVHFLRRPLVSSGCQTSHALHPVRPSLPPPQPPLCTPHTVLMPSAHLVYEHDATSRHLIQQHGNMVHHKNADSLVCFPFCTKHACQHASITAQTPVRSPKALLPAGRCDAGFSPAAAAASGARKRSLSMGTLPPTGLLVPLPPSPMAACTFVPLYAGGGGALAPVAASKDACVRQAAAHVACSFPDAQRCLAS